VLPGLPSSFTGTTVVLMMLSLMLAGAYAPENPGRGEAADPGGGGPELSPAPAGSPVTEAGISATAQRQKPDPLGASGSYMITVVSPGGRSR
jgi:hypothetical protein